MGKSFAKDVEALYEKSITPEFKKLLEEKAIREKAKSIIKCKEYYEKNKEKIMQRQKNFYKKKSFNKLFDNTIKKIEEYIEDLESFIDEMDNITLKAREDRKDAYDLVLKLDEVKIK